MKPNLIFIGDRIAVEYASLSNSECLSSRTSHDLHLDDATLNSYKRSKDINSGINFDIVPIFIYSMGIGDYETLSKSRYHGFWDRIYYDIKKLKKYGRTVYLIPYIESLIDRYKDLNRNLDKDIDLEKEELDKEDYQRIESIYTSIDNCIEKHEIESIDLRDNPNISIEEIVAIINN